jgi:hypothetical protein
VNLLYLLLYSSSSYYLYNSTHQVLIFASPCRRTHTPSYTCHKRALPALPRNYAAYWIASKIYSMTLWQKPSLSSNFTSEKTYV